VKNVNYSEENDSNIWNQYPMNAYIGRQPFMCQQEDMTWADQGEDGGGGGEPILSERDFLRNPYRKRKSHDTMLVKSSSAVYNHWHIA
jgi:hypothetical protein